MSRKVGICSSPTENVSITLSTSLLCRLDKYGLRKELTRSQIISKALKRFLGAELADNPAFWDELYDKYEEESEI